MGQQRRFRSPFSVGFSHLGWYFVTPCWKTGHRGNHRASRFVASSTVCHRVQLKPLHSPVSMSVWADPGENAETRINDCLHGLIVIGQGGVVLN